MKSHMFSVLDALDFIECDPKKRFVSAQPPPKADVECFGNWLATADDISKIQHLIITGGQDIEFDPNTDHWSSKISLKEWFSWASGLLSLDAPYGWEANCLRQAYWELSREQIEFVERVTRFGERSKSAVAPPTIKYCTRCGDTGYLDKTACPHCKCNRCQQSGTQRKDKTGGLYSLHCDTVT